MKGIYFASFYFRVWDLTREIRENKNPAKISTYTVVNTFKRLTAERACKHAFRVYWIQPLVLTRYLWGVSYSNNWKIDNISFICIPNLIYFDLCWVSGHFNQR